MADRCELAGYDAKITQRPEKIFPPCCSARGRHPSPDRRPVQGLAEGADEATGFSGALSFEEAFADAISQLPKIEPTHPDMMETVRVAEIGALFGGIAGFHDLYVRVCRTHD